MRPRLGLQTVFVLLAACSPGAPSVMEASDDGPMADDGGDDGGSGDDDGAVTAGDDDDGADDGSTGESLEGLPCDVATILATRCQECHTDPQNFGAPMPLLDYDDIQRPMVSDPARPVYDGMLDRLFDAANPMPPTGFLPEEERQVIADWIEAGTPSDAATCDPPDPPDDDDVGPEHLPCEVTHSFTAHAEDPTQPFQVPVVDDQYMCFSFKSPFGPGQQGTAWAPIVDDERVLHHWILYRTTEPQVDGGVSPNCNVGPGQGTFVAGWAPGGKNFVMPPDVGLELAGPDEWLVLQVHYNNTAGHLDAADMSGVAMCTTPVPREETAGVIWLGTFSIDIPNGAVNHPVSGMCPSLATGALPEPLHIISSFPHMHQLGRAFRTEILRGGEGGPSEILVDVPQFSFNNQTSYPHEPPVVINPGDALRTTCWYDNDTGGPVGFGENTSDEMCFNFALTYPIETVPVRECTF